jgi:2-polyprenyl-6-methoxyphenol hydroxylase-like FAD-dependent oxidoreductase
VGGGVAGMSCAIELAKRIHDVHLIDQDPQWRSYGAGITIQGPTFRALRQVGVAEEVAGMGYPCRGSRARLADGTLLGEVLTTALEPGLPDGGGILRPLLHAVLAKRTRASGVRIELATTISHIEDTSSEVTVEFNNGNTGVYDLVVGAFTRRRAPCCFPMRLLRGSPDRERFGRWRPGRQTSTWSKSI